MRHYPIFLDLSEREVLVAGAGAVGRRKIRSLLQVPVKRIVAADSRAPTPGLPRAANLTILSRHFVPEDLEGKSLAFAATDDPEANALLASLCARQGIWCNRADLPEGGDCLVPAREEKGGVTLAVGTGGKSPALARIICRDLALQLGSRYTALLLVLERLRPLLPALPQAADRAAVLRALLASPLAETLERGDLDSARSLMARHLPKALLPGMEELFHDL
ncbi:MAG: bifunctional precorrin-2 dehydrogenase/sirohydrochlorin ferrochelatase [Desulfovibrio sp.]|jgi:precorrin-2 dehydrogenase/sirohydrochlorin ferrochelatase|nr:bifunctional precorrin-2 dehydrogenase/sirohydrochlorin ferrochelatase [Desulfovibrio sp.]